MAKNIKTYSSLWPKIERPKTFGWKQKKTNRGRIVRNSGPSLVPLWNIILVYLTMNCSILCLWFGFFVTLRWFVEYSVKNRPIITLGLFLSANKKIGPSIITPGRIIQRINLLDYDSRNIISPAFQMAYEDSYVLIVLS